MSVIDSLPDRLWPSSRAAPAVRSPSEALQRARDLAPTSPVAALAHAEQAVDLALAAGDDFLHAWALRESASSLYDLGEHEAAATRLQSALATFVRHAWRDGEASCLNLLGVIAIDQADFETAHDCLSTAVRRYVELGQTAEEAAARYNLGKVAYRLGDDETALEHYLRCAELEERVAAPIERALTLGSIAAIERALGNHQHALELLETAHGLLDPATDTIPLAATVGELGLTLGEIGRFDEAEVRLAQALAYAQAAGSLTRLRDILIWTAEVRILANRHADAVEPAERAVALSRKAGEPFTVARALILVGRAQFDASPDAGAAAAIAPLSEALAIAIETGAARLKRDAHAGLAPAYERLGDFRRALDHTKALLAAERTLSSEEARRRTRALTTRYQTIQALRDAEIERLRNGELAAALAELELAKRQTDLLYGQLQAQAALLERDAHHDPLTGLANRRLLDRTLAEECERVARHGAPLALMLLDLDHFKQINDRFSHQTGDDVLRIVAHLVQSRVRAIDLVARFGGEEIVVLLPETTLPDAILAADRMRRTIAAYDWSLVHPDLTVRLSAGVAALAAPHPAGLLAAADAALYDAKAAGRNTVRPECAVTTFARERSISAKETAGA